MAVLTNIPTLKSAGRSFISLLFPNRCLVCKEGDFHSSDPICTSCCEAMKPLKIENKVSDITVSNNIDAAYAGWDFGEELRAAIHSLKYEERARIGTFLGRKLGNRFKTPLSGKLDGLVPVPLHPVKYRERGYNQAEWIAKGLGVILDLPVWNSLIKRVKYTISQTTLNQEERLKNMTKAFRITKDVSGKNIGIVDDVLTTGSTISSMAAILKDAGANQIIAMTVATPMEKGYDTHTESV